MADGKSQMDRMEDMLTQLICIVGKTNEGVMELRGTVKELQTGQAGLRSSVAELQTGQAELKDELFETKNVVFRIEHRLQVMERRQDKMTVRLDTAETKLELIQEKVSP